jgi:hypothetical protein
MRRESHLDGQTGTQHRLFMAVYLITYDLRDPDCSDDLLDYIKRGVWIQVTESSYAVIRNTLPEQIVADIRQITDEITVYVLPINGWAGYGRQPINEWFSKNVG